MWVVLSVTDSDKHFDSAVKEYEKRLGRKINLESVKPSKHGTNKQIIEKDTDSVISLLEKKYSDYYKIMLSKEGKSVSTEWLSDILKKNLDVVFVIWWPYGLNEEKISQKLNLRVCFGNMTLQHGLAKLVLLEQLYRISTIWEGKSYHY